MNQMLDRLLIACVCSACIGILGSRAAAQESSQANNDDYVELFNGKDLEGWDFDERFWRVEDGAIVGETSEENKAPHNTFLILSGKQFGDFELRFSYQVKGFNSGVQYRSVAEKDYVVTGYQADFEDRWHDDGKADKFSGMFFEEKGRMFMGQRGQAVIVRPAPEGEKKPEIIEVGTVGDASELEQVIRRDDWNEYVVIARGFQFTHIINGRVMAMGWDEDVEKRKASGVFAFQLHSGRPMRIKIKDLKVREL